MSRPHLECCEPYQAPYPSGYHWTHSKSCSLPSMRNMKVRMRTTHPVGSGITDHKPPSALRPLLVWFEHEPGCDCEACIYVDGHLDDDDDRTFEGAR